MRWSWCFLGLMACAPCAGASDRPSFLLHVTDQNGDPASPTVVSVNGNECEEQAEGEWYCRRIRPASAYIVDITGEGFEYYHEPVGAAETGRDECPFEEENEADVVLTPAGG